ncbi:MAG: hypothetical protein AABX83_03065 [Nanoarchaeota archaeon]
MEDLSYNISFDKDDLTRSIANGLESLLKDKTVEERFKIADETALALLELGNYAFYKGLIEYGIKLAVDKFAAVDET